MKTLIIFAKAPLIGTVKTRLVADTDITDEQALTLYEAFLNDILTMSAITMAETIAVHFTPESEEKMIRRILKKLNLGARNERRFAFAPQVGETFTDRIEHSFKAATEAGGEELVMIGSDSPLLKPQVIDTAFDFVYSRSGMALGPSGEGGLYLIGFPDTTPISFDGVFTEGAELDNLVRFAKNGNMPLQILPETLDVDVEADLVTLVSVIRAMNYSRKFTELFFPIKTAAAIEQLGLSITRPGSDTRGKTIVVRPDEVEA